MLMIANSRCKALRGRSLFPIEMREIYKLLIQSFHLVQSIECGWYSSAVQAEAKKLEYLERALAAHIARHWNLDDELAPFTDEESAFEWLGGGDDLNSEVGDYLGGSDRYFERTMWHLLSETWEWLNSAIQAEKIVEREHWNRGIESRSRLPEHIFNFIRDICVIWSRFVDPDLGLPRRDPDPDNPLIRFVRLPLEKLLGEHCPPNKTLHTAIIDHIRPVALEIVHSAKEREVEFSDPDFR
ncbi:hypothetical protein CIT31_29855 [Mesorhizobium wenxiniae]|uniref:Uncharacterized protein n=2 Tax=Mesorhizobium wenxiniae TaxID=2014805 RepID=A0A271K8R4_9HYPH|nr:hypothetical protein CIT31_29855 [Mesorhizobium wenxiniae]